MATSHRHRNRDQMQKLLSVVGMWPDWESNLQPSWCIDETATNRATQPGLTGFYFYDDIASNQYVIVTHISLLPQKNIQMFYILLLEQLNIEDSEKRLLNFFKALLY